MIFKGGKKKGGVLLQVLEIQEISFSSSSLFEILKEKKEFQKLKSKGISTNPDGGRDMRLDDDNEEQYNEIEEEEKKILTGNLGDKEPRFPRGSSKLVLSDGKNLVKAFELQKIKGLGLEEIKLGTKLLVFDVLFINGLLLLTPQNTIVKGFEIEELNFLKQFKIENFLREKLGLELLIQEDQLQEPQPQPQLRDPSPPPAQQNNDDEFDDDDEDDLKGIDFDLLQAQAIQQSQSKSQSKPSLISSGRKEKARIRSEAEDLDLQEEEEEEDEEEGWNVLNEIEQQQEQQGQQRVTKKIKKTNSTNSSSNQVKNEPESSESGNFAARSSKKNDNEVEVLELDSDDEEDQNEYHHQPLPSKRPAAAARGGGETSGRKVTVLEIDDSD